MCRYNHKGGNTILVKYKYLSHHDYKNILNQEQWLVVNPYMKKNSIRLNSVLLKWHIKSRYFFTTCFMKNLGFDKVCKTAEVFAVPVTNLLE